MYLQVSNFFAELIRELEGKKKYIGGGEESFGFLPGDYVRDKDGISSAMPLCRSRSMGTRSWEISMGITP